MKKRSKYSNNPAKFMSSELELDEQVKNLHILATRPDLFPVLVSELKFIPSILGLLTHENTDISVDVLGLLNELMDPDTLIESEESLCILNSFLENHGLELLIQNLGRLDAKHDIDSSGIYNTLSVIENLAEAIPSVCETICSKTPILDYLLKRLQPKEFDQNKLYSSEILCILLQSSAKNRQAFLKCAENSENGIDALLEICARFLKSDPSSRDEHECAANLFDALCSTLMETANQNAFRALEGFELMLRFLKKQAHPFYFAIRVINYALSNNVENCKYFVNAGGLKTLFPVFMGQRVSKILKKYKTYLGSNADTKFEKHALSSLCSLFINLNYTDIQYRRTLQKFLDLDSGKCDRIVEMHQQYSDKLARKMKNFKNKIDDAEDDYVSPEERRYLERLEAGLETLRKLFLKLYIFVSFFYF